MAALRKRPIVNLVFYDYSRFGRRTLAALKALEELDRLGVFSIAATHPTIDSRTAAGRTARREELNKAEDFSDQNSEKTSARMKAAFDDGRWCRPSPLGYQSVGTKIKGQPNIVPLESEAGLIRKSFELISEGNHKAAEVLRIVTLMGLRSKKGKNLNLTSFLKMLRNPVYIGQMKSKLWGTRKGLHEPLVDERLFRNVQLVLKGKKPITAPYARNREGYSLRRFLRCSECNTPLTGGPSTSETGRPYGYYFCYKCRAVKSVRTDKLHAEFSEMLKRLRPNAKLMMELPSILKEEWSKRTQDSGAMQGRLQSELRERRESQQKLLDKYLLDDPKIVPYFDGMNRRFEEQIAAIETQIAETEMERATFEDLLSFSKSLLVDIATAWERADVRQKQRVQNVLFPSGLKFHPEKGILNSEKDSLFNQLEGFVAGKMCMVRPERFELPT